jgi:hypothetical protein
MKNPYRITVENFKGRNHLGYLGIGETVILKSLLSKNRGCGIDSSGSG